MPTWTHEQTKAEPGHGPVAYANDVKAGSLLVACLEQAEIFEVGLPSDTRSNTWAQIASAVTLNEQRIAWWYTINGSAGPDTISFPDNTSNFDGVIISEWSVDTGGISYDKQNNQYQAFAGPGTDVLTTPSVTPAANNSLILALFGSEEATGPVITAGTNYLERGQTVLTNAASDPFELESRVLATAASVAATWTVATNPARLLP